MGDFAIRPATSTDLPLIYSSLARSFHGSPYYRDVPREAWTATVKRLINERLEAPEWVALIAHPVEVEDEIAGWTPGAPAVPR